MDTGCPCDNRSLLSLAFNYYYLPPGSISVRLHISLRVLSPPQAMPAPSTDEKHGGNQAVAAPPAEQREDRNLIQEKAAEFLAAHGHVTYTYDEEKRVLKKINWRVLPILLGSYFFQQLDKSSLR